MYKPLEADKENLFSKYFRIFLVVAAYWTISILTVFVNKALLSSKEVRNSSNYIQFEILKFFCCLFSR